MALAAIPHFAENIHMKQIDMLRGTLKPEFSKLSGKELLKHFSERRKPVYLFEASDAADIKDNGILEDAQKVMDHDIFGHKFNGPIDWMFNPTTETSRDNEWSWSLFRTCRRVHKGHYLCAKAAVPWNRMENNRDRNQSLHDMASCF